MIAFVSCQKQSTYECAKCSTIDRDRLYVFIEQCSYFLRSIVYKVQVDTRYCGVPTIILTFKLIFIKISFIINLSG